MCTRTRRTAQIRSTHRTPWVRPLSTPPPSTPAPSLRAQVIEGQYWMAPVSAVWLFSASAITELPRLLRPNQLAHAADLVAAEPLLFIASAALGFGVNICTFLVIKATNSVSPRLRTRPPCIEAPTPARLP